MFNLIGQWYKRHFSNPQVMILALLLIAIFTSVIFLGDILAPVIAAVVLAYILEGLVRRLEGIKVPRMVAVISVLSMFILLCLIAFFGLMPLLIRQLTELVKELPVMIGKGQKNLLHLSEQYPQVFSEGQIQSIIAAIQNEMIVTGQAIVSVSLASVVDVFTFAVYAVLVPMMVFFMLKDKLDIMQWCTRFLPGRRELATEVWDKVDIKIGSYIRGKLIEILIIWAMTYVAFVVLGVQYALLLSLMVGISVIIPYVGAIAVTVPVALIAFFQWGFSSDFWWLMSVYIIIQVLDGNVIVPLLFSEVVNLHPVAIIVAILFFGGLWGIWGIFFAIPLATLVDTVVNAWPAEEELST